MGLSPSDGIWLLYATNTIFWLLMTTICVKKGERQAEKRARERAQTLETRAGARIPSLVRQGASEG
ncbi:hypothetical protein DA11_01445 [Aeromonas caviae]|nr:hypothetical protein DA11_01445 [Aeromonas caviae]